MKMKLNIDIDTAKIMKARGLGSSKEAQKLLADTVERLSNPYVPMAAGSGAHMKDQATIASDGSSITYHGPHAHYQYVGEVMVGIHSGSAYAKSGEKKKGTGVALEYHGAPMRGKEWDKRMMADRGDEVIAAVAKRVGGKAK